MIPTFYKSCTGIDDWLKELASWGIHVEVTGEGAAEASHPKVLLDYHSIGCKFDLPNGNSVGSDVFFVCDHVWICGAWVFRGLFTRKQFYRILKKMGYRCLDKESISIVPERIVLSGGLGR